MGQKRREIAVVGGGLVGYAAAVGFAVRGFDTLLVAPRPAREDRRSTALIGRSVAFLSRQGAFDAAGAEAEPLRVMRLIDDSNRLWRAPLVEFRASEIGLDTFGYNILNQTLLDTLAARAEQLASCLEIAHAPAVGFETQGDSAVLTLEGGTSYRVALIVAADGRHSPLRTRAGIGVRQWSYPQSAIVLNFTHKIGHGQISNEFHTRAGPFTQVPLPGRRSSLVWVEEPRLAELYVDLKPERLGRVVEEKLHSILGKVEVEEPIQRFPLSGATVSRLTGDRLALIGEAAHAFPPIGAQGLNLGLRDAEAILDVAAENRDDPGRGGALARYEAMRRGDVRSRTVGVDVLNRSLLADFVPVQMLRQAGLGAMQAFPFLRQFAMREGVSPGAGLTGIPRSVREWIGGDRA